MVFNPTKAISPFKKKRGLYQQSSIAIGCINSILVQANKIGVIPVDILEVSTTEINKQKKVSKLKTLKKDQVAKLTGDDFI